jgi:glutamate racemase
MAHDDPIGVFDSGVGGLTVLRALVDTLPRERMVYLGDTARVPYGNRGAETVRQYARNAADVLLDRDIKALVVACNTASAHALETLQQALDIPVCGVIEPVARRAVETSTSQTIGVIGTRGTINSLCYRDTIQALAPDAEVHQTACPLLVPLAEEGWTRGTVAAEVTRHYLSDFEKTEIDTLILGCTHYPILKDVLSDTAQDIIDASPDLLDSATATAAAVAELLETGDIEPTRASVSRTIDFLLTDVSPMFTETAERFFGAAPADIEHIDIV